MNGIVPESLNTLANLVFGFTGARIYLVGGSTRNIVLEDESLPNDWDLVMFGAYLSEVIEIVRDFIAPNATFGNENHYPFICWTDEETGLQVELTVPRLGEENGSQPFISLETDAKRRALTIDALFFDLLTGEIFDPTGTGIDDLHGRYARPCDVETFILDVNRVALVMAKCAQYNLRSTDDMLQAVNLLSDDLYSIPSEVLGNTLLKSLTYNFNYAYTYLVDCQLLDLFPPLMYMHDYNQNNPNHLEPLHIHSLNMVNNIDLLNHDESVAVRLAGLFHDCGKPFSVQLKEDGTSSYHGHEKISADMAKRFFRELGIPKAISRHAVELISFHMRLHQLEYHENTTFEIKTICRLMRQMKYSTLRELMLLSLADIRSKVPIKVCHPVVSRLDELIINGDLDPVEKIDEFVQGRHIINNFPSIYPGPIFGQIIRLANDRHVEKPDESRLQCISYAMAQL